MSASTSFLSVVLGLHCLRDSSKRFLFFLLPLPLSSSSPLDDAVIKGPARSLPGALKSPANDKVFVLIARGTTEREGEVLAAVRGLRAAIAGCTVGWRPEGSEGKKSALKILFIFGATVIKSFYCVERVPQCGPSSGISSFGVNCK